MSDEEKDKLYGLEDGDERTPSGDDIADESASAPSGGDGGDGGSERPFDEPCPNCGAPMRDPDQVVCLRCGFDMKSLKVANTRIESSTAASDDDGDDAEPELLCDPATGGVVGGWQVPVVLAAAAGLMMIIGYLAGASGLYTEPDPQWGRRLVTALRYVLFTGASTACGVVALYIVAHLDGQRLGDEKLATARMLAMITVTTLVMFIGIGSPSIEFSVELVLGAAALFGLALLFFNMGLQLAGLWFGVYLMTQVALALLGPVLNWMYAW